MGEVIKSFNDWMLEHPNWYIFIVAWIGWIFPLLWIAGWLYYRAVQKKRGIPTPSQKRDIVIGCLMALTLAALVMLALLLTFAFPNWP
jgi:hypothetical protein